MRWKEETVWATIAMFFIVIAVLFMTAGCSVKNSPNNPTTVICVLCIGDMKSDKTDTDIPAADGL